MDTRTVSITNTEVNKASSQLECDLTTMDDAERTSNIFPFFKLARELRDEIYKLATIEVEAPTGHRETDNTQSMAVSVRKETPVKALLAVSRRFATEYKSNVKDKAVLVLQDTGRDLSDLHLYLEEALHAFTTWEIRLLVMGVCKDTCHESEDCPMQELYDHATWIEEATSRFGGLRSTTIKVYIKIATTNVDKMWEGTVHEIDGTSNIRKLAKLPTLKRVELYPVAATDEVGCEFAAKAYKTHGKMSAKWVKGSGWTEMRQ